MRSSRFYFTCICALLLCSAVAEAQQQYDLSKDFDGELTYLGSAVDPDKGTTMWVFYNFDFASGLKELQVLSARVKGKGTYKFGKPRSMQSDYSASDKADLLFHPEKKRFLLFAVDKTRNKALVVQELNVKGRKAGEPVYPEPEEATLRSDPQATLVYDSKGTVVEILLVYQTFVDFNHELFCLRLDPDSYLAKGPAVRIRGSEAPGVVPNSGSGPFALHNNGDGTFLLLADRETDDDDPRFGHIRPFAYLLKGNGTVTRATQIGDLPDHDLDGRWISKKAIMFTGWEFDDDDRFSPFVMKTKKNLKSKKLPNTQVDESIFTSDYRFRFAGGTEFYPVLQIVKQNTEIQVYGLDAKGGLDALLGSVTIDPMLFPSQNESGTTDYNPKSESILYFERATSGKWIAVQVPISLPE